MLVKLTPEQISKFWDIIRYAIEQSLPPTVGESPDKMSNILISALDGSIDVWASYDKSEGVNKLNAIMLTKVLFDRPSKTKNLLIYCLYGYDNISKKSIAEGFRSIIKYAKSLGCSRVVSYTELPSIIKLTKALGGEARYTFISFDVNEMIKKFN